LRRVSANALGITCAPADVHANIASVGPARLRQCLSESQEAGLSRRIIRGCVHEYADAPHSLRLLRPRRKRPCGCRTADERDELAALHSISLSAVAFIVFSHQPSGGRTTQNSTPLNRPSCGGAQTCAPPSGAITLLILSLGTGNHAPSTLTS